MSSCENGRGWSLNPPTNVHRGKYVFIIDYDNKAVTQKP